MAWSETTRLKYQRSCGRYISDTSDEEWQLIEPFMPPERRIGRRRTTKLRSVIDALLYMVETGCQWRMLPKDFYGSRLSSTLSMSGAPTAFGIASGMPW
jgi:hypothetical protein